MGEKPFRAEQIFQWIYGGGIQSFSEMLNVGKNLREKLDASFSISNLEPTLETNSTEIEHAQTVKFLFHLKTGEQIESVLIPDFREGRDRLTLCVSSQVGCAMSCKFCATGYMGFTRNLTMGEILAQVSGTQKWATKQWGKRITNVVFMGMGEPMLNYDNCIEAIQVLSNPSYQFQIGERHITLSTVGIVPAIYKLADSDAKFKLAVSLHSVIESKRKDFMPVSNQFSLIELRESLIYYTQKKNKPVFFEYLLLAGINDSEEDAKALVKFCSVLPCKINLIDFNPIANIDYQRSSEDRKQAFIDRVSAAGFVITVRRSRGKDIDAACGQLATRTLSHKKIKALHH
jgi:23S rRNA (adenine2503-C2)-methyltransferase